MKPETPKRPRWYNGSLPFFGRAPKRTQLFDAIYTPMYKIDGSDKMANCLVCGGRGGVGDACSACGRTNNVEILLDETQNEKKKVKSDGGDSKYYHIKLPKSVINKIAEKGYIEIEDIALYGFGNDFDFTTALKSLKRVFEDKFGGGGKEGSDATYNLKKVHYYADRIATRIKEMF